MGIQTERYKQRPRTGAIRHGALILKAKTRWVNSPIRRPTHVSQANQALLKHRTTMPKLRSDFKQTFVWFYKYAILKLYKVGVFGYG